MTEWTERFYCVNCAVVFREPFPEYADQTPCFYCGDSAESAWVPDGTTGFVNFSEMADHHTEYLRELSNDN